MREMKQKLEGCGGRFVTDSGPLWKRRHGNRRRPSGHFIYLYSYSNQQIYKINQKYFVFKSLNFNPVFSSVEMTTSDRMI